MMKKFEILEVRPYQLMCIICSAGGKHCKVPGDPKVSRIWNILKNSPNVPVMLRCNTISVYRYQNPGTADNTQEGELFNIFRDLAILQRMGLVPGSIRPAHELFLRIIENIPSTSGICGFETENSETWHGCSLYKSNNYENGIKQGIKLLYPERPAEKRQLAKQTSSEIRAFVRSWHLSCLLHLSFNEGVDLYFEIL
ncbi:MAG: hypothetical protein PHV82_12840 [Victivallaceae bacterium]|nr:hypothetical protein [Victivallaceae bacterium]